MNWVINRFLVALVAIIGLVNAASQKFTLKLDASGTKLDGYNLYVEDDGRFYISQSTQTCSGAIQDDGTLVINGETVGDGRNFLSVIALSTAWHKAEPWTIVDGVLELYGLLNFHVFPEGSIDDLYVLGTGNAMGGGVQYRTEVKIIPVLSDGSILQSWPSAETSSAVVSSTTEPSSVTEPTSTTLPSSTTVPSSLTSSTTEASSVSEALSTIESSSITQALSTTGSSLSTKILSTSKSLETSTGAFFTNLTSTATGGSNSAVSAVPSATSIEQTNSGFKYEVGSALLLIAVPFVLF